MPAMKPIAANNASPRGVRWARHSTSSRVTRSWKTPRIPSAAPSASARATRARSAFLARHMTAAIRRISTPSATSTAAVGSARPASAPKIAVVEPTSASGMASRRLAKPPRSSRGAAASEPESASSNPAPRTKSRWNGKNPPTIGTKSTPPPTPASTATIPSRNVTTKSAIGQTHHGAAGVSAAQTVAGAMVARVRNATGIARFTGRGVGGCCSAADRATQHSIYSVCPGESPMKTSYREAEAYVTKDGSEIRELMHPARHGNRAQSLAEATVAPGAETHLHQHRATEELYHITQGVGLMTLGDDAFEVRVGDTVAIPPGIRHRIRNLGTEPLRILCCCAPAYAHDDTELV